MICLTSLQKRRRPHKGAYESLASLWGRKKVKKKKRTQKKKNSKIVVETKLKVM